MYTGSVYSRNTVAAVCPWCIADGSAASKFDASFVADLSDGSPSRAYSPGFLSRIKIRVERIRFLLRKHVFSRKKIRIDQANAEELFRRTPGFASFQEEVWQMHCDEPCEFHGQARVADLRKLTDEGRMRLFDNSSLDDVEFQHMLAGNDADELHYYFKYVCCQCGEVLITEDLD